MLSSLRFMFDNHFTSINVNNERILFDETRKIAQRTRSRKSVKHHTRSTTFQSFAIKQVSKII